MNLKSIKILDELVENKIISKDTASTIQAYYNKKESANPNQLFTVFGVLGSLLVGLGIILIIAHNWDTFPKITKTIFAFIPLIIAQIIVGYVLLKQKNSTWREASGTFLFFTVGASIALISQIYNIPGNLGSFLLTWTLLCLPLVYILQSNSLAILHIIFSTYYATQVGYFSSTYPWMYLLLIALIVPYYFYLWKKKPTANSTSVLTWLLPFSLSISLGAFIHSNSKFGFLMYVILFGMFYNIGKIPFFDHQKIRRNSFLVIGSLGTIATLLFLSFNSLWKEFLKEENPITQETYIAGFLFIASIAILGYSYTKKWLKPFNLFRYVFIVVTILFLIHFQQTIIPVIIINILILLLGLTTMKVGADTFNFGILNYGLLIITALIVSRFFDTNLSFVVRGLLFIIVGLGFFFANYVMLKKQEQIQKKN